MKHLIILALLAIISPTSNAQSFDQNKIDAYLDTLGGNNRFMGSVSIFRESEPIYNKTVGFADTKTEKAANDQTQYAIGSISKTFTAVMIFQAIESNLLELNQTLDQFFPTVTNANRITIRDMLKHRSGIYNYTDKDYTLWHSKTHTKDEMLEKINAGGAMFEPNEKTAYSNGNYLLLSYILEEIYDQPYSTLLQTKIARPLELKQTHLATELDTNSNYAESYTFMGKWLKQERTPPSNTLGAGGIISTPYELNLFANALFSGKLITKESLDKMMEVEDNLGMGLMRMPFYDQWGYGHTGGIDGFHSMLIYLPRDSTSLAIISNGLNYPLNDICVNLLNCVYGKEVEIPNFHIRERLTSEDLDKYLGVYSSESLPIKLTITKNQETLVAQGTGQMPFRMSATTQDTFEFKSAGITIKFAPQQNTLTLIQGGRAYLMKKE